MSGKRHRHHSSRARSGLYRLLRYRLLLPLLRSHHPPQIAARGTAVGLILAFTPTIGLHTIIAGALWAVTARSERFHFSLILALAWTWASNPITALPIYYLLYVTGQMMFGHWGHLSGYADFIAIAHDLHDGGRTLLQDLELMAKVMLEDLGLTMLVGSIPWAALVGGLGYWGSMKFIERYRREKAARRARKH
ncbi:DUF2062 domain-containing protein [Dongia sp.]|uniref:DUF2062 domain-containing protein n=1 Tax=Dongia sp. TaxID=1977262 RepID=UPI0035B1D4B3